MLYGAIEAGGTKFRCAIMNETWDLIDSITIPTITPLETIKKVVQFFQKYIVSSIGVGAFGPINLKFGDPDYGVFTTTPKLDWQHFPLYQYLKSNLDSKIMLTTDVSLSALGEYYELKKSNSNLQSLIYLTIGTGIGAGVIYQEKILKGNHHTEMGHFQVVKHINDHFQSLCPYHDNCLEGLASGLSLTRYDLSFQEMGKNDLIWDIEGYYLAQAIYDYTLAFSPDKIIIGGGVSHQEKLLPAIKFHFYQLNNQYLNYPELEKDDFISTPILKDDSAIYGGINYAREGK